MMMNNRGTTRPMSHEDSDLKPEQQKVLEEIYQYVDSGHLTEEDLKLGAEMFDSPEKFKLLRKILGVLTKEERGLTFVSAQSLVQADVTDLQKYAVETAVNNLADEKIRNSLFSFYRNLRAYLVNEKKTEFDEQNQAEFEEEKRKEAFEEENQAGEFIGPSL